MPNARAKAKASCINANANANANADSHERSFSSNTSNTSPSPAAATVTIPPALVICRNKHWRYISSYHGPWLNLPPEVLESLACTNFYSPRPQPIDPAVFFDLVKIRRLIDEATGLAVRAANGTTSATLNSSFNAANGILNGADVDLLGLSLGSSRGGGGGGGGGGGNAKLSRERKHRMREHATQKLAAAYRVDEIAASVATMQSASALEDVAKLVLQRQETDANAQYVHFFHEKIPSRALAESTTLDVLTNIIRQRPTDPATYRTRAITSILKDDYVSATRDLTDGLAMFKLYHSNKGSGGGHSNDQRDLILARDIAKLGRENGRKEARVDEKDQPSSLEAQFLFHRANTYLTLASEHISAALQGQAVKGKVDFNSSNQAGNPPVGKEPTPAGGRARAEARKMVRTYAKRALRDYLAFLSHLEYTPGLSSEHTEAFLQKLSIARQQSEDNRPGSRSERLLNLDAHSQSGMAEALVKYNKAGGTANSQAEAPYIPKPKLYKLNTLFSAVPPADLPPYPYQSQSNEQAAAETSQGFPTAEKEREGESGSSSFNLTDFSEAVTYHPLLMEVIHSVLLCHCLIQTSAKEHRRHAYMVARIARVCDGYPIFLAARSPARADWVEILRRCSNFLDLDGTWDQLCRPRAVGQKQTAKASTQLATAPAEKNQAISKDEKPQGKELKALKEQIKRQAIEGALADERVVDEETFKQSVRAREEALSSTAAQGQRKQQKEKEKKFSSGGGNNANGHANANAMATKMLSSDRADAVIRWICEAPLPGSSGTSRTSNMNGTTACENGNGTQKSKTKPKKKTKGDNDVVVAAAAAAAAGVRAENVVDEKQNASVLVQ